MSGSPQPRTRKRGLPPAPRLDVVVPPAAEESPFLRPRTRARVRTRRRSGFARTAFALQLLAALLAVAGLAWTGVSRALASERLRVAKVRVRGNHFLSQGEVRELMGLSGHESILALDMPGLARRLKASPWVADASVRRSLPDTLEIEVVERAPLALAEIGRLYLMDAGGDLIDLYEVRTASYDLPIVRGLQGLDEEARRERAQRAAALLEDLGELQSEVSEISVEPSGELQVVLRGGGELLRFGPPPYRQRLETFLALRRELNEHSPQAEYFDLRYRGRIYAKEPAPPPAPAAPNPSVPAPRAAAAPRPAVAPAPTPPPTVPAPAPPAPGAEH